VTLWRSPHVVSFAGAVPRFVSGEDTPRKFLERCLETISARDRKIKAFVTLNLSGARKSADAATRHYKSGKPLSPVDGCPIAIKDIIATADMPTRLNSPVIKNWLPGQDAACVAALRKGGAVIIGKTVTTEFAMGRSGPTINPFDPKRTPGGSSSGSAAAAACGMVPAGLGTQTIGSVLRPASYCGVIGFKPTAGMLHMGGIHPLSATCDHLGVLAGTLDDAWRVASQISLGIGSPGSRFLPRAGAHPPASMKPRKLIRLYTQGWAEIDNDTKAAFEEVVAALQARGVSIASRDHDPVITKLEDALVMGSDSAMDIAAYEMQWPFDEYIARFGKRIGPPIQEMMQRARRMTPSDYESLLSNRRRMQDAAKRAAAGSAGFITLASSGPAGVGLKYTGSRTFPSYGSWLGLPAFSLPLMQVNGLPVGVQLLGLHEMDDRLCATAGWMMRELT
jgi:Asp-tRNA(Asn)/Glu-tRNA(Gln) amidotransferase A subunit family amidase